MNHMRPFMQEAAQMRTDRQSVTEARPRFYGFAEWCDDQGIGPDPDGISEIEARQQYEQWKIDHGVDFRTGKPQC